MCIQCGCIFDGGIRLCLEAGDRHRTAGGVHGLALLRAVNLNFRHSGNVRRAARGANPPCGLQRCRRCRIVHQELQLLRLDLERLTIVRDGRSFLDACRPAAALNRQLAIRSIDLNICIGFDCAPVHIRAVLICDARILREMVGAIRQANICVDVLLIRICTENARRELGLRLRRIDGRRIDIASLSVRPIKCDILDAFAGGRCRQTFGNLRLAREVPLARRIGRVPELIGKCVERCTYKIFFRSFCRLGFKSRAVRRQRNGASRLCILDAEIAAFQLRWPPAIVLIEHARMTAVVIDRDGFIVLLEDHARMIGVASALQGGETAARKGIVILFADSIMVFIRYGIAIFLIVPYGAVLQPEVDRSLAKGKTVESGVLIHHSDINPACRAHGADVAVNFYNMAACRAVLGVDKDLPRRSGKKR